MSPTRAQQPTADTSAGATAVIYVRVSTKEQAERDGDPEGYSIPAQREACKRKAASLDAAVIEEFVDRGESARTADRPELQRLLDFVLDNPRPLSLCFLEGDADLSHAAAPKDPDYLDVLVSHTGADHTLGLHAGDRHVGVDEYSFVLEGRMGALLGDEVIYAEAGELAFKPRDQWHTFWNAGDEPCRILEVISPGGFEHFFREFDESIKDGSFDPEALSARYGIEHDMESVPRLCAEHGLVHPLL